MQYLSRRIFVTLGAAALLSVAAPAPISAMNQEWLKPLVAELSRHHAEDIPFEISSPALEKITREHFQAFLEGMRLDGKLFAYDVICDDRNNNPQTRDLGQHNLQICVYETEGSAPIVVNTLRPENFTSFAIACGGPLPEGAAGS